MPVEPIIEIPSLAPGTVDVLERELGCSGVIAQVLARRGLEDPSAARAFLAAADAHRPDELRGIGAAVDLVLGHVARGSRITVHGDYDCDGVCSTAILVALLRELGADVDWYLPDRLGDGYGLAGAPSSGSRLEAPASDHGRLRDHRRRAGRAGPRGRDRGARHRSPQPARGRRAPRRPIRAPAAVRLSLPGPLRDGGGRKALTGAARARRPGRRRAHGGARARGARDRCRRDGAARREPPPRAAGAARAVRDGAARPARADGGRARRAAARSTSAPWRSGSRRA